MKTRTKYQNPCDVWETSRGQEIWGGWKNVELYKKNKQILKSSISEKLNGIEKRTQQVQK